MRPRAISDREVPFTLVLFLTALAIAMPSAAAAQVVAAVLPSSRSIQVGGTATAFATILNSGTVTATGCTIAMPSGLPTTFSFQRTDARNVPIGSPNTPVDISANSGQTFVLAFTPSAAFGPVNIQLLFGCTNTSSAPVILGVNTLLLSASTAPVPDIVMLSATTTNNGIVAIQGTNGSAAFAVATVNVGTSGNVTVSADTGGVPLPLSLTVCQTNSNTGVCLSTPQVSVSVVINGGATPTFAVFVSGLGGKVPLDPAINRIFVRATDTGGGAIRGSTSVAVATATAPPVDPLLAKTQLLKGHWHFVETIGSAVFTDDYTLTSIDGSRNSQGGYWIFGQDQYGDLVDATYWPNDGYWALLDPSPYIFDSFFVFYTDGRSILPGSCYYLVYHDGHWSQCYPLTGVKTSAAAAERASQDSSQRVGGEVARSQKAEGLLQDTAPISPAVIEGYWLMKELAAPR